MTTNHITQAMANPEIIVELGRRFKEYRLTYRLTQKRLPRKPVSALSPYASLRTGRPITSIWATFLPCYE